MLNIEDLKENYKNFNDEKIIEIAKNSSKGLEKEVIPILNEEILKRKLDKTLLNWVAFESEEILENEQHFIYNKIVHLACPNCLQKNDRLYGFKINKIVSFVIFCDKTINRKILCRKCGKKQKLKSILITFFAGWWSKEGVLLTPITVISDIVNLLFFTKISNQVLNEFIGENIGRIRARGSTSKALSSLIDNFNKERD